MGTTRERIGEPPSLTARLLALAHLLPEGASLVLDRTSLAALAASEGHELTLGEPAPDLTVAEAAERLRLSANRIRAFLGDGRLEGYRIAGKGGWRVTPAALEAFRRLPSGPATAPASRAERVNLGRWRKGS